MSGTDVKFQWTNRIRTLFIPILFDGKVIIVMKASTPRLAGIGLRLIEGALRSTPLPRLVSRLVIERKLRGVDFAAEGEPAPYYMPPPYQRKHRP